jgi:hypothetical protein
VVLRGRRPLTRRVALLRILLALETIPDFIGATKKVMPQVRTLQEHSLTSGAAFESLIEPLLLAIPPTSIGYAWGWMPHGLVFLFGHPTLVVEEHPPTFASLYAPRLHGKRCGLPLARVGLLREYIEVFHNHRRRHSSLGMLTPIESELLKTTRAVA